MYLASEMELWKETWNPGSENTKLLHETSNTLSLPVHLTRGEPMSKPHAGNRALEYEYGELKFLAVDHICHDVDHVRGSSS